MPSERENPHTLPLTDEEPIVEIATLAVEVLDGPDVGRRAGGEDDVLAIGSADGTHLRLSDPHVSRFHCELELVEDGIRIRDTGSTNGVWLGKARVTEAIVGPGTQIRVGDTVIRVAEGEPASQEIYIAHRLGDLCGRTEKMRRLLSLVDRAGKTDASVLITGESGTGKELVARALHDCGSRRKGPFVTVDCGALAANLVASELFGHERGAFTGADRRREGAFAQANGGTLFLDEVGELPADLQPTLLGALERRRFRRVGGSEELSTDVRVVAATHRDLRDSVNSGSFRLDLFYRLAVIQLKVPPLRERRGDIELLCDHFLAQYGEARTSRELFGETDFDRLVRHDWPGNVRELRNAVEARLAMGETFGLPEAEVEPAVAVDAVLSLPYREARAAVIREFEASYFGHHLSTADGNVAKAARLMRMDRSHLFTLLREHPELR